MELCNSAHEEVCYESRFCPVCALREEKNEEIEKLKEEIKSLEDELNGE